MNAELKKSDTWKLNQYAIHHHKKQKVFSYLYWFHDGDAVSRIWGMAFITADTLVLKPYKVRDSAERSLNELDQWRNSLPAWNMTKYYVKLGDLDTMSDIMICQPHEPVPAEVADLLMPKLFPVALIM